MGKSCCAVGCTNRLKKGSGIQFYRFPEDKVRRGQLVAAVGCKNWKSNTVLMDMQCPLCVWI